MLAREVTTLVHGADHVTRAEHASSVLFGEDIATLSADQVLAVFGDVSSSSVPEASFDGDGLALVDLLADPQVRLAPSKSEARRLVQSGGVYVNNRRIVGSAGEIDARSGDRRAVVRAAQRSEAEPSRPFGVTVLDRTASVRDTF